MDNIDFLETIARAYPKDPYGKIEIWEEGDRIVLNVNGCRYSYDTLTKCVNQVKESFANLWIEQVFQNNKKLKK